MIGGSAQTFYFRSVYNSTVNVLGPVKIFTAVTNNTGLYTLIIGIGIWFAFIHKWGMVVV